MMIFPSIDRQDRRQTPVKKSSVALGPSISKWSTTSTNNHLSFSKSCMLSVLEAMTISYSDHLQCQSLMMDCQSQTLVTCWLFVDIHSSAAFPILPMDIENRSRLLECTLLIVSIFSPLNSQISFLIWQQSVLQIFHEEWAMIGNSTIRCIGQSFLNSYGV